jgi:hypothetical protein
MLPGSPPHGDYAEALAFMRDLLDELPWPLGGPREQARGYLERAVAADGSFTGARLASPGCTSASER